MNLSTVNILKWLRLYPNGIRKPTFIDNLCAILFGYILFSMFFSASAFVVVSKNLEDITAGIYTAGVSLLFCIVYVDRFLRKNVLFHTINDLGEMIAIRK